MEPRNMGEMVPVAQPIKPTTKPEIVTVGKREIISSGRWNDELVARYVLKHGEQRWVNIGELAAFAWGQNNIANKGRVRRYISRLWKYLLLEKHLLLSVTYGESGGRPAVAVKIYDHTNDNEREALKAKLNKAKETSELSCERYEEALELLEPKAELGNAEIWSA